jgi:hypothetical protein
LQIIDCTYSSIHFKVGKQLFPKKLILTKVKIFNFFFPSRYLKTASNNNSKESKERSVPRKSRKSQPKRNIKHTVVLDSEDSGDHLIEEVTEDPWREVSVSSIEESETDRSEVDLSRVKLETSDVEDLSSKHSDKGRFHQSWCFFNFLLFLKLIFPTLCSKRCMIFGR